jgi:hypothetical protein
LGSSKDEKFSLLCKNNHAEGGLSTTGAAKVGKESQGDDINHHTSMISTAKFFKEWNQENQSSGDHQPRTDDSEDCFKEGIVHKVQ